MTEVSKTEEEELRNIYAKHGQAHVFDFWSELDSGQRLQLVGELREVDVEEMMEMWTNTNTNKHLLDTSNMQPVEENLVESVKTTDPETLMDYEKTALRAIAAGEIGVLLLAGGQGTRLGVPYPKGMYNIGLPSGKTLYQIQVERILKLEKLAERLTGQRGKIRMYIMTSEHTKLPTQEYFTEKNFFGASKDQISIFEQRTIPAFSFEGKLLMSTKHSLARSPDGNGGLYWALREENILQDLLNNHIRYVHVYCVDNVLVKVADPRFMGYCISRQAESGNKVCEKKSPDEAVGVVARIDGKIQVVEYSEISQEKARLEAPDGRLLFREGNICNHFFTTDFLQRVCSGKDRDLPLHIARKKVPCVDQKTGLTVKPESANGIKIEKFVFDVFQFANSFVVWECERDEEFSPLKNGPTASSDNPMTAKRDLLKLHRKYLERAGVVLSGGGQVEISPDISYHGEGLEQFQQQTIATPTHLH